MRDEMREWGQIAACLILMGLPQSPGESKRDYLPGSLYVCRAALAGGTSYEIWERVLLREWEGRPLYVQVRAYYRPGSGELLWRSSGYTKTGYESAVKEKSETARESCGETYRHILVLQDGEWADFWAENGRIVILHSDLKFARREKAWEYIAEHWRDGTDDPNSLTKLGLTVLLYDRLGRDFFRPKALEFDARPYSYDSLLSAKKSGCQWELEIRGADEPNRAKIWLDKDFHVVSVAKETAIDR